MKGAELRQREHAALLAVGLASESQSALIFTVEAPAVIVGGLQLSWIRLRVCI
jgi:hypothetical protein